MQTMFRILWTIIIGGLALMLLSLVAFRVSSPDDYQKAHKFVTNISSAIKGSTGDAPTVEVEGPDVLAENQIDDSTGAQGGDNFNFQRENTDTLLVIDDPSVGLTIPAFSLIPERVSTTLPVVTVSQKERVDVESSVIGFLRAWENYEPDTTTKYERGLLPVTDPEQTSRIVSRSDNRQPDDIGACELCEMGSVLVENYLSPADYLRIRSYNTEWAYVTTQAVVMYTGDGAYSGQVYRRSYGMVLHKFAGKWRVARVAAESLDVGAS